VLRGVGPNVDEDLAAKPVGATDPADDQKHRSQRTSSTSTKSIRTP
jgi:hypothetical protein